MYAHYSNVGLFNKQSDALYYGTFSLTSNTTLLNLFKKVIINTQNYTFLYKSVNLVNNKYLSFALNSFVISSNIVNLLSNHKIYSIGNNYLLNGQYNSFLQIKKIFANLGYLVYITSPCFLLKNNVIKLIQFNLDCITYSANFFIDRNFLLSNININFAGKIVNFIFNKNLYSSVLIYYYINPNIQLKLLSIFKISYNYNYFAVSSFPVKLSLNRYLNFGKNFYYLVNNSLGLKHNYKFSNSFIQLFIINQVLNFKYNKNAIFVDRIHFIESENRSVYILKE